MVKVPQKTEATVVRWQCLCVSVPKISKQLVNKH